MLKTRNIITLLRYALLFNEIYLYIFGRFFTVRKPHSIWEINLKAVNEKNSSYRFVYGLWPPDERLWATTSFRQKRKARKNFFSNCGAVEARHRRQVGRVHCVRGKRPSQYDL